jgi:phage-related protein
VPCNDRHLHLAGNQPEYWNHHRRRKRAKFGDGYAQAAADGLNATSRSYQLQFVGNRKTINEIVTFLDGHAGRSFLWKGPLGQGLYMCDSYTDSHLGGQVSTITATFEQTFHA